MKTIFKRNTLMKSLVLFFSISLMLSCSPDGGTPSSQSVITAVVNNVTSGTWRITYYFDSDHEETSNYAGYNFTFASGNVLTAANGTNSYTGTWSVTSSSSSSSDVDFNILFSAPPFLEELSDDWDIISYNATEIQLIDVSGGNGGIDLLTFTKN